MKSWFGSRFCHDDDAAGYDADVRNETHPIRKGYAEAQRWIGKQVPDRASVLDLGTGTGNTILALPLSSSVTAVDISRIMLQVASQKCVGRNVRFVLSDVLEYFDSHDEPFDAIVSAYTIHHLTNEEKAIVFERVRERLKPGGSAIYVDLMFRNTLDRDVILHRYSSDYPDLVRDMEEEFFWNMEREQRILERMGFHVITERFSDLSWGVRCDLRTGAGVNS